MTTASSAPSVAATAATTTAAAHSATAAALGRKRHICRTSRNPERAEARGKSQNDKPGDKLFTDRAANLFADERSHDVSFP
jgi:hypothetical protein